MVEAAVTVGVQEEGEAEHARLPAPRGATAIGACPPAPRPCCLHAHQSGGTPRGRLGGVGA